MKKYKLKRLVECYIQRIEAVLCIIKDIQVLSRLKEKLIEYVF